MLLRDKAERYVRLQAAGEMHYPRKNINGMRTSWKSVNELKIFAAERLCPVNEYVTKARTEARAGRDIAKAFIAVLISKSVRIYLNEEQLSVESMTIRYHSRTQSRSVDIQRYA
jgi:hypothetical protein